MASIHKRKDSPYWWINYRSPNGDRRYESTKLRHSAPLETKKARAICTEKTLAELNEGTGDRRSIFDHWVVNFLTEHYHGRKLSFDAQLARWNNIRKYLISKEIHSPRHLTYEHCFNYVKWRTAKPEVGYHQAGRNTAIQELKTLGFIMRQAVRRGYVATNPCSSLGLEQDDPKEKPEMGDGEIDKIRDALKDPAKYFSGKTLEVIHENKGWMGICFEIAIHQGCRLTECQVPFSDVGFDRKTITFDAKGNNRFTTALHPGLEPLLLDIRKSGAEFTCILPIRASKVWWRFFRGLKLYHLCFHCTRVTVITRLARAGVPISQAMRFVGHASATIHRVYQRLSSDDLDRCLQAVQPGSMPQSQDAPSSIDKHP